MEINKSDINELDYWGWECPKCENWNETQEDPNYTESVYCESCREEFNIIDD